MHRLAEFLLGHTDEIVARKGAETIRLGIEPSHHDSQQFRLLLSGQHRRAPAFPAVAEPGDPVLIIADHPIAQCLAVHAGTFGGFCPACEEQ